MNPLQDAFISYGRADSKQFAKALNDRLVAAGLTVWFDFDDIPLGVDYQKQIDDGIEKSDNFLFLISPHAINSPYCALEVELAVQRGKRIIPILHVEQIRRETWQARNPQGTEAEWAAYQAAGKHDHFANMPPILRKLNWIYCREGQDDVEQAVQSLLQLMATHQSYVRQHTELLVQALAWERNHRQAHWLLVGNAGQLALDWLTTRFTECQPPCHPVVLQGEFITESLKHANHLMTQVFLAYADPDRAIMEQIRRSLWLQGITVWTNTRDIQTGDELQQAIHQGIERADNVIFLLSPAAAASGHCEHELNYAIALHKRIIPVRVGPVESENMPAGLQDRQFIDLADHQPDPDCLTDAGQLLRLLQTDAAYYHTHKVLLVQALKWKEQHQNPSILLRGYNLRQADAWLKTATDRSAYPPTPLQVEFIQASLRQPPAESLDVFISYSRADAAFARRLNDTLQVYGKLTWFDQESIASASADFRQEIYRGIEAANNIVFILSPQSVQSPYCADEVEYAAKLNKRFITLLHQPIDAAALPPALAPVQWLDFTQPERLFWDNFNQLVRVLETDREYLQSHTKWSQRAIEWQQKQHSEDLLLRGTELDLAQRWQRQSQDANKQPAMTALQQEFIAASQHYADTLQAKKQQRTQVMRQQLKATVLASVMAIGGLFATGLLSWMSFNNGQKEVTELGRALSEQISHNVKASVVADLQQHYSFSRSVAIAAQSGALDIYDLPALQRYIWHQFQQSPRDASTLFVGNEAGHLTGFYLDQDEPLMWLTDEAEERLRPTYAINTAGQPTTLIAETPYDPRQRSWYQAAMQAQRPIASDIHVGQDALRISLSEPIYDVSNQFVGVASADLSLDFLQTQLAQIKVDGDPLVLILQPTGALIATSSGAPLIQRVEDAVVRTTAQTSADPLVAAAADALVNRFASLETVPAPHTLTLDLGPERYMTNIEPLGTELGLDWLIVTLIPKAEIMDEIHANARMTVLFLVGGLALAIALSIYVAKTVSLSSKVEQ